MRSAPVFRFSFVLVADLDVSILSLSVVSGEKKRRGSPAAAWGWHNPFASGGLGGPLGGSCAGGRSSGGDGGSGGSSGAAEGQAGGRRATREEDGAAGGGASPTAAESPATQPAGHDRTITHEHPHQ